MEKEKLKKPYLDAEVEITQILLSDVIQTSGEPGEDSWNNGSNVPGNGWTQAQSANEIRIANEIKKQIKER